MMKFVIGSGLAALSVATAFAQTPVAQKIGIIEMQSALVSTKDGQKAVADLRAKFGPKDQDMQKRQADLQAKQEQLRKTQNTISEDAKAKLSTEIDTLGRALQRDMDDAKADMDQEQQRVTQDLGGKLMQVVNKYAVDNKFNLIFDISGQPDNILFASNTLDITRDIIALYDKAAPTSPTSSAAPAAGPAAAPAAKPPATPPAATPAAKPPAAVK